MGPMIADHGPELASSDLVDIQVSFITGSGVRKLQDVVQQITAEASARPTWVAPAAVLTGGLDWTVKLTQRGQEALFARAVAHLETLWADG